MAAALPVLQFASAAFSIVGAIKSSRAESQAANYNAQTQDNNAIIARQQAAEDERLQRIRAAKQLGIMRAGYGASGVTPEGSPLDVLSESAAAAEYDAITIRKKGEDTAQGYAQNADLYRRRASAAESAGMFKAASATLLAAKDYVSLKPAGSGASWTSGYDLGSA